ncbi:MAG: hypothetical protein QOE06_3283 [Thermoleophilaceae bacterium]|nr:hypothetical protein [Thermoleophilaceae bacterium]
MHTRLRAAVTAVASTIALGALAAPAAQADALSLGADSCGTEAATQPFSQWGDTSDYIPVPGGSFESDADAWSLSGGAAVVDGNESFYVNSDTDSRSLSLPTGSSATSPPMCTSIHRPTFRFFARNTGSRWSNLRVDVLYPGPLGNIRLLHLGLLSSSSWSPSLPMPVVANLLSVLPGASTSLAFRFTPTGSAGEWSIDDVYVDPAARR